MDKNWEDRTKIVLGDKVEILHNCHIAVLGCGGVGGSVVEMLARLGIGQITVIDFDDFDETNLNRQILCTRQVIGKSKVDSARDRIIAINPDCLVTTKKAKVSLETIETLLDESYDYVIDAVDDIQAKIAIIKYCNSKNIKLICSMGAGNRFGEPQFKICDLWKTSYDGLARKLRNELKKDKFFEKVNVCYTTEPLEKTDGKLGSIVYYPLMCGCILVSYVINDLLKIE